MNFERNQIMDPSDEEQIQKSIKTVFHLMTAKRDSKSKVFNNDVRITRDSIDDLNNRILRKIRNHYDLDQEASNISVHINFDDRRELTFSGYEAFSQDKLSNPSIVRNITIKWSVLLKLPYYEQPQIHELVVKMTDGLKPQELMHLLFAGKLDDIESLKLNSSVVASVDFIDYQLGDEFLNIVGEWVDSITVNSVYDNIMYKLSIHSKKISRSIKNVITIICLYGLYFMVSSIFKKYNGLVYENITISDLNSILSILFYGGVATFFISRMSYYLTNNIYRVLNDYNVSHVFDITSGDKKLIEKLKK